MAVDSGTLCLFPSGSSIELAQARTVARSIQETDDSQLWDAGWSAWAEQVKSWVIPAPSWKQGCLDQAT